MQYTEREIVREYNSAKYRNKKIGVLAQLNLVTRKEIIDILERNGVEVPQKYKDSHEEEYKPATKPGPKKETKVKEKTVPVKEVKISENVEKATNIIEETEEKEEKTAEVLCGNDISSTKAVNEVADEDIVTKAIYKLVAAGLDNINHRLCKIEKRQKRLEKYYKLLANIILRS